MVAKHVRVQQCCAPEHSEQMCTQLRHACNYGGISDAAPEIVGQRPQDAILFVARRNPRAFVRASANSAGRFGAVPKYTSSGVWPRNAECGIWVLCCLTGAR